MRMINLSDICDLKIEGIDRRDHPDYCDAYISEAWINDDGKFRELTEEELEWLNNQGEYLYEQIEKNIY